VRPSVSPCPFSSKLLVGGEILEDAQGRKLENNSREKKHLIKVLPKMVIYKLTKKLTKDEAVT